MCLSPQLNKPPQRNRLRIPQGKHLTGREPLFKSTHNAARRELMVFSYLRVDILRDMDLLSVNPARHKSGGPARNASQREAPPSRDRPGGSACSSDPES